MLPIFDVKAAFQSALEGGCVVLTAPTGSGKSTQVPKFVLEKLQAGERVLVLQPRRLAARMLAERVAFEMGCRAGELVGYQTRYEKAAGPETRILFLTEGILTRMLTSDPGLPGVGAIIFDEFHERSLNTDLGIAMARETRRKLRPDLRLIVMSATIEAAPVCAYLGNCPHISSAGRMYDVEISYCTQEVKMLGPVMAACKALSALLATGMPGDVLVFMPGGYEIRKTVEEFGKLRCSEKLSILPLYGDLPPEEQRKVMLPGTCRKVIVATNIAETSLTIPGVRHVIDSGLARFNRYDPVRGVDSLETGPIARDAADQRAGRAGREAPGTCQRLWSWLEHSARPARTIPEIQRVDLAETVLAVNAFGFHDMSAFPWYEAPPSRPLAGAEALLVQLGFLKPGHSGLTELGRRLQSFPAHPRLSLLMWLGAGEACFGLCAWAAAILSERPMMTAGSSPRPLAKERRQTAKHKARAEHLPASDFLTCIELAQLARDLHFAPDACQDLGIHGGAARDVCRAAEDYLALGRRNGWGTAESEGAELAFLKCLLRAFPDRLARRCDFGTLACELPGGRHAELARESVVRDAQLFIAGEIREVAATGIQSTKLALSLASGIEEEWLLDYFPDAWEDLDEVYWDDRKQQVFRRRTLSCLGLCLEEKIRTDPDPEKAAEILAEQLISGKENIPGWDENLEHWIDRVRWVAGIFPEENLPAYNDEERAQALKSFCYGAVSLRGLKDHDLMGSFKQILTRKQQQFIEEMAPPHLLLPNGRRMKISYAPGQTPKGRGRIQDFYDLPRTPFVAGGRIKILLDILAPNNRTVQITDDLENFWKVLYPKIRTELSRRYPRHLWK